MQQIIPGVYTFTGLMAGRSYAIEDSDGVTLIDTSIPPAGPRILKQLAAAGHPPSDVRRILITHAHPDHVGGLPALKQATGADVYASLLERTVIQDGAPIPRSEKSKSGLIGAFMSMNAKPMHVPVDHLIADGERLMDVMGGLQALATPGHAPGHMAFWQPERGIAFIGDTIFNLNNRLRLPYQIITVDMDENLRSIAKVVALEPKVVCFGHGPPLTDNAAVRLREFARRVGAI